LKFVGLNIRKIWCRRCQH